MSNFGFFHLRVVNPYDVAYAEARSAVNASEVLERSEQFPTVADAVADCGLVVGTTSVGPRSPTHPVRSLERAGALIAEASGTAPVALLFGSEKFGLSNDDLALCHWLLRIPTRAEHHSMNLGQSVAVCLYELIRSQAEVHRVSVGPRPALAGDVQRAGDLLVEILRLCGYTQDRTASSTENKIRRLLNRMSLSESDVRLWQGILRQILWKLRGERA